MTSGAGLGGVGMEVIPGAAFRATGLRRAALRAAAFFAGLALRAAAFLAGLALRAVFFFRRATFLADAFFAEDLRAAFFLRGD